MKKKYPIADNPTLLKRRVSEWAIRLRLNPKIIRVQHMSRKWGSCSDKGILTLAIDLQDQDPKFQDYVIVHELLHMRVKNHGKLFKAFLTNYIPNWRHLDSKK